ncbi:hypothetical protein V6N12_005249 [Hibiscus sabdariffa]|uniref:Uncharacterized protein n=1 Tax=Hibiscus sabdariffa TaxID=183260 RepID=A0ABR2CNW9_9ROSI
MLQSLKSSSSPKKTTTPELNSIERKNSSSSFHLWHSRCEALSNDEFERKATGLSGVVPEDLVPAWYWINQFAMEVIYHNRVLNHECRTTELDSATVTAFYIPFYAGLAVGKYLWRITWDLRGFRRLGSFHDDEAYNVGFSAVEERRLGL